jgi:glycine/D-amino acid oxidase-like deaminating enzyme
MITSHPSAEIAVIGAGSIGISVTYCLNVRYGFRNIAIIDPRDPMSLTSAQSGENYRNWWPHPVMTAFTNDGIRLLEEIATKSENRINMTRRGYALVTRRRNPQDLIDDLYTGYGDEAAKLIRIHEGSGSLSSYQPPASAKWEDAPGGVDVLCDQALIRKTFPSYQNDVETVLHVRRAGSISGQQLGQYMLEQLKENGARLIRGSVTAIDSGSAFTISIAGAEGLSTIKAERIVNAAGPYVADVAAMLGQTLNTSYVYQQKIAFEDRDAVVPRDLPFTIDLDGQTLSWTEEEREILAADPATAKLIEAMPAGIHCRPDGAESGKWIKLGWAFNHTSSDPHEPDPIDDQFPDIVLRGASRLQPGLANYIGRLPRGARHYGGYYTTTEENWPLIGPTSTPGVFVAGALSGFGTMAACVNGALCADWIGGTPTASYAKMLAPSRYQNPAIIAELNSQSSRGHL